jgi:hypothetical protein
MPPMSPTKADAIYFLRASIVRYRHQLDTLSLSSGRGASNVVSFAQVTTEREELNGLIEDARSLLSQLKAG